MSAPIGTSQAMKEIGPNDNAQDVVVAAQVPLLFNSTRECPQAACLLLEAGDASLNFG